MTNEQEFAFVNTAITIFCLTYSLNISHSNQTSSFCSVECSVSISSKFSFRPDFLPCDFTIATGDDNKNDIFCLSFPGSQPKFS